MMIPDRGCLFLSLLAILMGVMYFLFPHVLLGWSKFLNRLALQASDERLLRYRYFAGLLCFMLSYGLFKLALTIAENPLHLLVQFH